MSTAILVPCYKRPEYTLRCINFLEKAQKYPDATFYLVDDNSNDGTDEILKRSTLNKVVIVNQRNKGLRNICIDFFEFAKRFDYMVKIDNDCLVPENWLHAIERFLDSGWVDIVSPNVFPSNAAYQYGSSEDPQKPGIRPSNNVGGLWAMKTSLLDGISFEKYATDGIRGAFALLNQIIVEKEPRVGWLPDVVVQDVGHFSGTHPDHIASEEHQAYSAEVGRKIAWNA